MAGGAALVGASCRGRVEGYYCTARDMGCRARALPQVENWHTSPSPVEKLPAPIPQQAQGPACNRTSACPAGRPSGHSPDEASRTTRRQAALGDRLLAVASLGRPPPPLSSLHLQHVSASSAHYIVDRLGS
eukprot:scaffold2063_cov401-Prasinococcus_capsulatus_cf.AAC.24